MPKLKDFPTDEDYNNNPDYYKDFLKHQREFKDGVMKIVNKAGDDNLVGALRYQITYIGTLQLTLKKQLLENVFDGIPEFKWSGRLLVVHRKKIMNREGPMPKWQRKEMIYVIDMYHDILKEINKIYNKRRKGL